MAKGLPLNVACCAARSQCYCGDTALGELFWVVQAKQGTVSYGAVRTPSSLGLRCLMRQCLPPNPCEKCPTYPTVPQADWPAPRTRVLCFCTSTAALVAVLWQGQKSQHPHGLKAQGREGKPGSSVCQHHSEMSHEPPVTCTGANRSSIPTPPLHWE